LSEQNTILDLFSFNSRFLLNQITYNEFSVVNKIILGHFTTSTFLNDILKYGLLPPIITSKYSNDDIFVSNDAKYIYLTTQYSYLAMSIISRNAVNKYGGEEIVLVVEVNKEDLELDNLNGHYTKQGITDFKDEQLLYEELTQNPCFSQCRIKKAIRPNQILKIINRASFYKTNLFDSIKESDKLIRYSDIEEFL